jgi:prepilin-type N-terminal cleavage/methylation domain-containing protein
LAYFGTRGFTLVELMVTVGIFVFMTALLMAKYNDFYSGIIFKNMAYDIAITIRQAQSYGISVKVDTLDSNSFNKAYGVHFSSTYPAKFSLHSYYKNGDIYTKDSLEKSYNLKFGAIINRRGVGDGPIYYGMKSLDIVFQRPNPEAIICGLPDSDIDEMRCTYKYARIELKMGDNTRLILVNNVGLVSILD